MKQSSIKKTWVNCNNMLYPDQNKISTSIMDIGSISVFGFMKFTTYAAISHFSTVRSRFLVDFLCLVLFPSIQHCKICVIGDLNQPDNFGPRWYTSKYQLSWSEGPILAMVNSDSPNHSRFVYHADHEGTFRSQRITAFFLWPALHLPSWEDFFLGNYLEDLVSG